MRTIESCKEMGTALSRIAWLSAKNHDKVFHSLMHHIDEDALRMCYQKLDGRKAVGEDKISKDRYGENLESNLKDLVQRMKRMSYRPGPVRQVQIPKEGKAGATRTLGISNIEDKLVQKRIQELLEAIYDPIFLERSYGFRKGRGCHDAIKALHNHLYREEVETVIDIDLENFFDTIDHGILKELLKKKIKDTKFLRYIQRLFRAGVLAEGELQRSEEGVVQGSCCSPVLANIMAHYVLDIWIEETVKPLMRGKIEMFRYADDCVCCCEYEEDAIRLRTVLPKRLEKYKLKLNESKTKLVSFSKRKAKEKQQGSFDFLGFTFYLGRSRQRGNIIPKLKTNGKRFRAKLKRVNVWAKTRRNRLPLKQLWKRFCNKLRGHIRYYGVSFNYEATTRFVHEATRILYKWINRRSQRKSFNWDKFNLFIKRSPLPEVKIYHKLF